MTTSFVTVALCALAVGAGALRDSVLCRGDDGHVSIERALSGQCDEVADVEDRLAPVAALAAEEGCCGPCSDFLWPDAALMAPSFQSSARCHAPVSHGLAWAPNPVTIHLPASSCARWALPTPTVDFLQLASTSVLRC